MTTQREAALEAARATMRNVLGAIESDQIEDKEVRRQLKRGIQAADEALAALKAKGGEPVAYAFYWPDGGLMGVYTSDVSPDETLRRAPLYTAPPALEPAADVVEAPITLKYRNHRGECGWRVITPKRLWFGSTEWHPEPQWLLTAYDHDKKADRDFALRDFGRDAALSTAGEQNG